MSKSPEGTAASVPDSVGDRVGLHTERRIARLTLVFGSAASAAAAFAGRGPWAAGLLIGAVLGWLNFRSLRRGMDALVAASAAQAGAEKPRVPLGAYFAAVFRYALIALLVYVIFKFLRVPLASMVVGMCALAAAAMAASVYELWDSDR
jgi:small-conductance mechanosensitive channel